MTGRRKLIRGQIDYFNKRRVLEMRQKATVEAAAKARDENVANRGR
jgi:cytochrome c oxidase assembly factor 6